jgi:drug/metabolite transporter (DMT)-like permease
MGGAGQRLAGIALIAVSAASFGTLGILGRYVYADGMDTLTVMFLRFWLAATLMAVLLVLRPLRGSGDRKTLPRGATLLQLLGMGGLGYVGQAFSYLTALRYASPGLVALLLYLYPMFVTLLSVLWLRERITRTKAAALAVALAGAALTVEPGSGQLPGVLLAIAAAAIYSVYIVVGARVMQRVSAFQSSTVIFASAGAVSGVLMLANGPHWPATSTGWAGMAAMVLVATVLPVVTFLAGLERIGPTNAAMLSTLEPLVTVLLAAWLLSETLKPLALLGGGLILVAALLLTHSELRRNVPALPIE